MRALENMYLYNVYTRFSFIMPAGHRTRRTFTTFTKLKDSFFFFFRLWFFVFIQFSRGKIHKNYFQSFKEQKPLFNSQC